MMYPVPRPTHTSMDLGAVKHLEVEAGSVVIYFNTLAHGVWGWRGVRERRAVMSKAFNRMHPSPSQSKL
jgi:ectoine hydroxylase-related dioxygenase (phytanoyl-CoA dioxygenase family)